MSEPNPGGSAGEPRKGLVGKVGCASCLGLALLGLLGLLIWNVNAGASLDARVDEVRADIKAAKALGAEPRPVLVGEPAPGDAVEYYRALEWAWGSGLTERAEARKPTIAGALEDRERSRANMLEHNYVTELEAHANGGDPPSPEALAAFEAYRALTHYVRDGLRRERCDWNYEYGRGFSAELPNLITLRQTAQILAYAGFVAEDPEQDLERCMELFALAADLGRNPSLIGGMIAVAVERIGALALERALSRRTFTAEHYQRLLTFLGALPRRTLVDDYLPTEWLGFEVSLLGLSGRQVDPSVPLYELGEREPGGPLSGTGAWFYARELAGHDHFAAKSLEVAKLPPAERDPAQAALNAELEESSYFLVSITFPNLLDSQRHLEETLAVRDALRVVVAAQLHRLEHGAFPEGIAALEQRLGGALPEDPFRPGGGPLSYLREGDSLRVYSWGANLADDQGAREGPGFDNDDPDAVVRGRVPAE